MIDIAEDESSGANDAITSYREIIRDRRINSHEAIRPNPAKAGDHDMRRDKAVIFDGRMMADMVATPKNYIVTNSNERLHNVVFKNKTMLSDSAITPDERPGADIGCRGKTAFLRLQIKPAPKPVFLGVNRCGKKTVMLRVKPVSELIKWNHRKVEEGISLEEISLDAKSNDFVIRVPSKVLVSDLGERRIANN